MKKTIIRMIALLALDSTASDELDKSDAVLKIKSEQKAQVNGLDDLC